MSEEFLPNENDESEVIEFEKLIEEQGGQSKFQLFAYLVISISINVNSLVAYNLGFLLLLPQFNCSKFIDHVWKYLKPGTDQYEEFCNPAFFCDNSDILQWEY